MPADKDNALKGMKSLDKTTEQDKKNYIYLNRRYFDQFDNDLNLKAQVIDVAWNNHRFRKIFGKDTFNQLYDNGSGQAYNYRKKMLDEWEKQERSKALYQDWLNYASPYDESGKRDNNRGLGELWEQYSDMSPEGIKKVLQSDYLNKQEIEKKWRNIVKDKTSLANEYHNRSGWYTPDAASDFTSVNQLTLPPEREKLYNDNQKILDKIYNDDIKERTYGLGSAIEKAYNSDDRDEESIKKDFINTFVSKNSDMVKNHKGVYAAYWNKGEMEDFSVDDMRKTLAKYKVYTENMPFNAASTALNNEAKVYIRNHQGSVKRGLLFAGDFATSMASYATDIYSGIYSMGLLGADLVNGPEDVYLDDKGNIMDPAKLRKDRNGDPIQYNNGKYAYTDDKGNIHYADKTRMSRNTLHNLSKNADGSDEFFLVNPQFWSDVEQYGTFDRDEQEKYKNLGVSPYKVAYNPNEDSDIWYESFKMGSFFATDALMLLIPTGVGWAGKALQTVSKTNRILNYAGKFMEGAGKLLSTQSKVGQTLQGTSGALGIAHAYERGTFQETLANNLTKIDETVFADSNNAIHERYNNDPVYKQHIDNLISERAEKIKQQRLSELPEGQFYIGEVLDKQAQEEATNEILSKEIDAEIDRRRAEDRYQKLYTEAVNSAGTTAAVTFVPEALKYVLINNWGYRKFIYRNPSGFTRRVPESLKGISEKTLENGTRRLVAPSKFNGVHGVLGKAKQFGIIGLKHAWGGAWTNGSDDMMVDAAEQINEDSFTAYMNNVYDGDAQTSIYGLGEALISYFMGLSRSLGQETTYHAALVGGLGSTISISPNAVNIASMFTKSGRKNFAETVNTKYLRDKNGVPKTDTQGNPQTRKYRWWENLPRKFDYFIQNGILSTYYGKHLAETDLALRVNEANKMLDQFEDFKDLKELVATNMMMEDITNEGDGKTGKFLNALAIIRVLESVRKNSDNPLSLSSVYNEAIDLIDGLSELKFDPDTEVMPEGENIDRMMSVYYKMNPDTPKSEDNGRRGLGIMIDNAKHLRKASDAYAQAEQEVAAAEKVNGVPFSNIVRRTLLTNRALLSHWQDRLDKMRNEIGDSSQFGEPSDAEYLAMTGNDNMAYSLLHVYSKELQEALRLQMKQKTKLARAGKELKKARKKLAANTNSDLEYELSNAVADAFQRYEDESMQLNYINSKLNSLRNQKNRLNALLKDKENKRTVLTADDIFALDPVTRACMLHDDTFSLYSEEQQKEINKLKERLVNRDPDALNKIQDISKLASRIERMRSSYNTIIGNADAATRRLESMQDEAAEKVPELLDKKFAQSIAGVITEFDNAMKPHKDITEEQKGNWVYRQLRRLSPRLLNIIDREKLLPAYQTQIENAKRWSALTEDLDAVISMSTKSEAWKKNARDFIGDIIEKVDTASQIMSAIGQAIEDSDVSQNKKDLQEIEQGLINLGYQKGVVKVKSRKERKEQEERRKEEQSKNKEATEKAVSEAAARAKETEEKKIEEKKKEPKKEEAPEIKESEELEEPAVPKEGDKMIGEPKDVDFGDEKNEAPVDKEQQKSEEKKEASDGTDSGHSSTQETTKTDEGNIVEVGEDVAGQSKSLEQQNKDTGNKGEIINVSDVKEDLAEVNNGGEKAIETNTATLLGNAMSEWENDSLREEGVLKHKRGKQAGDVMNRTYDWLKSAGIHIQDVIDDVLALVLKNNPHTKVKFMVVRPDANATRDSDMQSHLMLVIDYDERVNTGIIRIHPESKGSIIKSNGRKYLVIGVAGYGNNEGKRSLYNLLYGKNAKGLVGEGGKGFFDIHPDERFFVDESFDTEIVPGSLIPGYVVNQLENDEDVGPKKISEILADEKRNPHGYKLDTLNWAIQMGEQFTVIAKGKDNEITIKENLMGLRNRESNMGRVFVLVEASNGKYIPLKVNALKYNEMNDGALKNEIAKLINMLVSPIYKTRIDAIKKLSQIFLFNPQNGDSILTRETSGIVTFMHDGEPMQSFNVEASSFDRSELFKALERMNPRVNVTKAALKDAERLRKLDEAGALMTDAAKLGTAGASYSIYGVDFYGNMLGRDKPSPVTPEHTENSNYRNPNKTQVIFRQKYYTKIGDSYYLNGKLVTKEDDIKQLEYNRLVIENEYKSVKTTVDDDYYVLDATDNPKVIKINRNTKEVTELTTEESKELIDSLNKKDKEKERKETAKKALEESENPVNPSQSTETANEPTANYVTITRTSNGYSVRTENPQEWANKAGDIRHKTGGFGEHNGLWYYKKEVSGSLGDNITIWFKDKPSKYVMDHIEEAFTNSNNIVPNLEKEIVKLIRESSSKEQKTQKPSVPASPTFTTKAQNKEQSKTQGSYKATSPTKSFEKMYSNMKNMKRIESLIRSKWKDAPTKADELTEFLRKKNIEVDAIGTSKEDFDAWLKTIEDCR